MAGLGRSEVPRRDTKLGAPFGKIPLGVEGEVGQRGMRMETGKLVRDEPCQGSQAKQRQRRWEQRGKLQKRETWCTGQPNREDKGGGTVRFLLHHMVDGSSLPKPGSQTGRMTAEGIHRGGKSLPSHTHLERCQPEAFFNKRIR